MTALVTEDQYRRWSFDKVNEWDDPALQSALDDALADIEEYTNRHFESATRTETLRIFYKTPGAYQYLGYFVVPSAPPIASVSAPVGGAVFNEDLIVGISPPSIFGGGLWGDDQADFATVTYTGGFTSATLPVTVGRVLAKHAFRRMSPNLMLDRLPPGVTSVKNGDLALAFKLQGYVGDVGLDRGSRVALRAWRRVEM